MGIDDSEHDEIIESFVDQFGSMCDVENIDDAYQGKYSNFRDFSDNLFDDCYLSEIPAKLRCYIDYEAFANDLNMTIRIQTQDTSSVIAGKRLEGLGFYPALQAPFQ